MFGEVIPASVPGAVSSAERVALPLPGAAGCYLSPEQKGDSCGYQICRNVNEHVL